MMNSSTRCKLLVVVVIGAVASASAQSVRFVDSSAGGANDGSNWGDAFVHLQDALAAAASAGGTVSEIWVADGVYRPDLGVGQTSGARASTFRLLNGVSVYGGFAGAETLLAQRDPGVNVTTLSGDLAGNDGPGFVNYAENCLHVVTGTGTDSTAVLDGFAIVGGNANTSSSNRFGGGLLNRGANGPTLVDCAFLRNRAEFGGAVFNDSTGSPTFRGCVFEGNLGVQQAGGVYTNSSGSPITLTNCIFRGNSSPTGGGMFIQFFATLTGCVFTGNAATLLGGSLGEGGGIYTIAGNPVLTNCTFTGNTAQQGGAMHFTSSGAVSSFPTLTNCISWGNSAAFGNEIINFSTSRPTISFSDIQGSGGSGVGNWVTALGTDGGGNLDADPQFADANGSDASFGTVDDDVRLFCSSPCIDAGKNAAVPVSVTTDPDKNARFFDAPATPNTGLGASPVVDIGAYEFNQPAVPQNIACPPDAALACGSDTSPAATGMATAAAACTGAPLPTSFSDVTTPGCGGTVSIVRTWSAVSGGTPLTCDQVVSTADNDPPTLVGVPADGSAACDAVPAAPAVTAEDGCDPDVGVSLTETRIDGACPHRYTLTRTWSAMDACGNTAGQSQTISVSDTTPPALVNVPADAAASCNAVPAAAAVSANDACDPSPAVSFDETRVDGTCPDRYTLTRSWTATDACANGAVASQNIAVDDSSAPSISCPASATRECPADTSAAANGTATGEDDCGEVSIGFTDASAAGCGGTQAITRTWTATDDCFNTTPCAQTITVIDTTPPAISVSTTPITVTDVNCSGSEVVTLSPATADDACQGPVSVSHDAPASFPAGATTTVTYSAADGCGNTRQASRSVTVRHGAKLRVKAVRYLVGHGSHPLVNSEPLDGILVKAYRRGSGSCADQQAHPWGLIFWHHFDDIVANCTPVAGGVTNANGEVFLDVPPGHYVVISHFDSDDDGVLDQYLGDYAHGVQCGEVQTERLFTIKVITGRRWPCKYIRLTGSELLIVEPEYVLWDEPQQLYPFVLESVGDWGVAATVTPPEGFVADHEFLSEEVNDEVEALQFTVTEIGSDLVPTQTEFNVTHKGRVHTVRSRIDIRLTEAYARSRGFDPGELRTRGLIMENPAAAKPATDRSENLGTEPRRGSPK